MVDVSAKSPTVREAVARGHVSMHRDTLDLLGRDQAPKGNVLDGVRSYKENVTLMKAFGKAPVKRQDEQEGGRH